MLSTVHLWLFCTVNNKRTINWQIITILLHVSTLHFKLYYQKLHLKYLCNLARYWLQAPWGWHDSVETCSRSVIICEIIVHLLVIVQNKKKTSFGLIILHLATFYVYRLVNQPLLREKGTVLTSLAFKYGDPFRTPEKNSKTKNVVMKHAWEYLGLIT